MSDRFWDVVVRIAFWRCVGGSRRDRALLVVFDWFPHRHPFRRAVLRLGFKRLQERQALMDRIAKKLADAS